MELAGLEPATSWVRSVSAGDAGVLLSRLGVTAPMPALEEQKVVSVLFCDLVGPPKPHRRAQSVKLILLDPLMRRESEAKSSSPAGLPRRCALLLARGFG
jgi:hypothetical protein